MEETLWTTGWLTPVAGLMAIIWLYLLLGRGMWWSDAGSVGAGRALPIWPGVVAVVPARNEAEVIGDSLLTLLRQDYRGDFHVVLVDDHSTDDTDGMAEAASVAANQGQRLTIVKAGPRPPGWAGKPWAMREGVAEVRRSFGGGPVETAADEEADAERGQVGEGPKYILFCDADIAHAPDTLETLVRRAESGRLDLTSLMVRLNCSGFAERAMIPAFVYFFQLLYPFAWVASPKKRTAAAAGGVMLVRRAALEAAGGIERISDRLIDDCALADLLKNGPVDAPRRKRGRIWLGLANDTSSIRAYGFGGIWAMIRRSAYTQLRCSPLMLVGSVVAMVFAFAGPPVMASASVPAVGFIGQLLALFAWVVMMLTYLPILRYYGSGLFWAPFLPVVAMLYTGATIASALRHHAGRGGEWKGRVEAGRRDGGEPG